MTRTSAAAVVLGIVCVAAACGSDARGSGGGGDRRVLGPAHLDPSDFVATVDNPYFPLAPGTVWEYKATEGGRTERIVVTVLDRTKMVDGVTATVVHDVATTADGEKVVEDTYDWYAQDKAGSVWYLGEDTKAHGKKGVSTKGSWEAGVDGARAGLLMLAHPAVGKAYQQEYQKGEAEDRGEVLAIDEKVTGPTGSYDHVVKTADTTPLEPRLVENKWYAPGVGIVQEADLKGGDETVTLVKLIRP
jgi:hypothetical protein